jgi:putative toxin-antitoxin system antitoxin component (TIGR02293 family)
VSSGGSRAANAYDAPRKHGLSIAGGGGKGKGLGYCSLGAVADFFRDANLLIGGENFMSDRPLADAYEGLKDLRRKGGLTAEVQSSFLRAALRDLVETNKALERELAELYANASLYPDASRLTRLIEIKTLAGRVFGDDEKAEAWLRRPNVSLSGQRPVDLLKDELGTAVVREILERIDHGIFG